MTEKTYRLVKPMEISEKGQDFLYKNESQPFDYSKVDNINRKFSAILEERVGEKVVYAWPIENVSEIWDIVEDSDIRIKV